MGTSKNRLEKGKWVEVFRKFGAACSKHVISNDVEFYVKLTSPTLRTSSLTGEDTPNARDTLNKAKRIKFRHASSPFERVEFDFFSVSLGKPPRNAVCLTRWFDEAGGVLYTFSL